MPSVQMTATSRIRAAAVALALFPSLVAFSSIPVVAQESPPIRETETSAGTSVSLFEARLRQTAQQMQILDGRMPKLRDEAQDWINQISALTKAPDPAEKPDDRPAKSIKKVLFRPPLGFVTQKQKQPLGFYFQNQRIRVLDIESLAEVINDHVGKINRGQQGPGTATLTAQRGDFDAKFTFTGTSFSIEVVPKPGHLGETESEALSSSSNTLAALANFNPSESMLQCLVYPDSFEIFQQVRAKIIWEKNIEAGWKFAETGKPIYMGGGKSTSGG